MINAAADTLSSTKAISHSLFRAAETLCIRGRNNHRPRTIMLTRTNPAPSRDSTIKRPKSPWSAGPKVNAPTRINRGTTAKSCINNTEKHITPSGLAVKLFSPMVCITMAVEDNAKHTPSNTAVGAAWPNRMATPPITAPVTKIWLLPSPKTMRRISRKRSSDSSSPIINSRAIMPNSASRDMMFP